MSDKGMHCNISVEDNGLYSQIKYKVPNENESTPRNYLSEKEVSSLQINEEINHSVLLEKFQSIVRGSDGQELLHGECSGVDNANQSSDKLAHLYSLQQMSNLLLIDAKQCREYLLENLRVLQKKMEDRKRQIEIHNHLKVRFVKKRLSFRNGYFIDECEFSRSRNDDEIKLAKLNLIPLSIPSTKLSTQCSEKLLKLVASQIRNQTLSDLLRLRGLSRTSKNEELMKKLEQLEQDVTRLMNVPDMEVAYYGHQKKIELDWDSLHGELSRDLLDSRRTVDEVKRLWYLALGPHINTNRFEKNEINTILKVAKKYKYQNWDEIAKTVGTKRTGFQCFVLCQSESNSNTSTKPWTKTEEAVVVEYIRHNEHSLFKNNFHNTLSLQLPGRSHLEISKNIQRIKQVLKNKKPTIVKGRFTKDEESVIEALLRHKMSYQTISALLGNRTDTQIRDKMSRKYRHLTAMKRKGIFSTEEDERLMELVEKYGTQSWPKIAKIMRTRDRTQCRHRFNNICYNLREGRSFKFNEKLNQLHIPTAIKTENSMNINDEKSIHNNLCLSDNLGESSQEKRKTHVSSCDGSNKKRKEKSEKSFNIEDCSKILTLNSLRDKNNSSSCKNGKKKITKDYSNRKESKKRIRDKKSSCSEDNKKTNLSSQNKDGSKEKRKKRSTGRSNSFKVINDLGNSHDNDLDKINISENQMESSSQSINMNSRENNLDKISENQMESSSQSANENSPENDLDKINISENQMESSSQGANENSRKNDLDKINISKNQNESSSQVISENNKTITKTYSKEMKYSKLSNENVSFESSSELFMNTSASSRKRKKDNKLSTTDLLDECEKKIRKICRTNISAEKLKSVEYKNKWTRKDHGKIKQLIITEIFLNYEVADLLKMLKWFEYDPLVDNFPKSLIFNEYPRLVEWYKAHYHEILAAGEEEKCVLTFSDLDLKQNSVTNNKASMNFLINSTIGMYKSYLTSQQLSRPRKNHHWSSSGTNSGDLNNESASTSMKTESLDADDSNGLNDSTSTNLTTRADSASRDDLTDRIDSISQSDFDIMNYISFIEQLRTKSPSAINVSLILNRQYKDIKRSFEKRFDRLFEFYTGKPLVEDLDEHLEAEGSDERQHEENVKKFLVNVFNVFHHSDNVDTFSWRSDLSSVDPGT